MSPVRELFSELIALWSEQGSPFGRHLPPGASNAQLDWAEERLGFPLSEEIRDWYGAHDGFFNPKSAKDRPPIWPCGDLPGDIISAVQDHFDSRALAEKLTTDTGVDLFRYSPTWITLVKPGKSTLVADSAAAAHGPAAPIHKIPWDGPEEWSSIQLPSITALLQAWLQLTRDGSLRFDQETLYWHVQHEAIPPELRLPGVTY